MTRQQLIRSLAVAGSCIAMMTSSAIAATHVHPAPIKKTHTPVVVVAPKLIQSGQVTLGHKAFQSLIVNGGATLYGTTVNNQTVIKGQLDVTNAHLHQVTVNGTFDAFNTTIKGPIQVSGLVRMGSVQSLSGDVSVIGQSQIENSEFNGAYMNQGAFDLKSSSIKGPLMVTADKVSLKDSIVSKVMITDHQKPAQLILNNTTISSNVTFKGIQGVVILKGNSHINGQLINGVIRT